MTWKTLLPVLDGWWYVQLKGPDGKRQQVKLVKGREKEQEAYLVFCRVMAEETGAGRCTLPARLTVAAICDLFLDFSQKHHEEDTFQWYRYFLQSFCDHCGKMDTRDMKPFHVNRGWTLIQHGPMAAYVRPSPASNARSTGLRVRDFLARIPSESLKSPKETLATGCSARTNARKSSLPSVIRIWSFRLCHAGDWLQAIGNCPGDCGPRWTSPRASGPSPSTKPRRNRKTPCRLPHARMGAYPGADGTAPHRSALSGAQWTTVLQERRPLPIP